MKKDYDFYPIFARNKMEGKDEERQENEEKNRYGKDMTGLEEKR